MIATLAQQAIEQADRRPDRHRRPRRLPADRRAGPRQRDGDRTGDHRDQALRPRRRDRALRHRARADPGLLRAQGRHLRQHPGRAGDRREDRRRAAPELRLARGVARAHRRGQRRQAPREPDQPPRERRISKRLATMQRDLPSTFTGRRARRGARPRACARPSAATSCAIRCGGSRRPSSRSRSPRPQAQAAHRTPRAWSRGGSGESVAAGEASGVAVRAPRSPRARCSARAGRGVSPSPRATRFSSGDCDGPAGGRRGARLAPIVTHDAKSLGRCRRRSPSTRWSPATCWTPLAAAIRCASSARIAASTRVLQEPAAAGLPRPRAGGGARQIEERGLERLMEEVELPLVAVLRAMEEIGITLDLDASLRSPSASSGGRRARARDLQPAGEEFLIASPSSSARSSSTSSHCRASAAARPASRPTRGSCPRFATNTRSCR